MLTAEQRTRYARHLLLAELGEEGQERLCAARVRLRGGADARASAAAGDYLARAGVTVAEDGVELAALPASDDVARLAGDALLEDAAAILAGAFVAVEAIKRAAGVGTAAALPARYALQSEETR